MKIPYRSEQGNKSVDQGGDFDDQGLKSADQRLRPDRHYLGSPRSSVVIDCVVKRTNRATVSPPAKRMNSAPSPLIRLSSAKLPVLPCIMWMSCTPSSGAKPNVWSLPGSLKNSPKAITTALWSALARST